MLERAVWDMSAHLEAGVDTAGPFSFAALFKVVCILS